MRRSGDGGRPEKQNMFRNTSLILASFVCVVCVSHGRADEKLRITPDVIYGHKNGMALVMHVYRPAAANGAAVVQINSGGYFSNWEPANPRSPLVGEFLKSGYTVFSVFHGSNPKYTVPEIVGDMRRAIRFIRLHATDHGIDARRIGVFGASAGGHLALMLATTGDEGDAKAHDEVSRMGSRVAAAVALAAPCDLRRFDRVAQQLLDSGVITKAFNDHIKPAFNFDPALADSLSPVLHVTRDDAPTMLLHGDADRLVSIDNSRRIFAQLQEKVVPSELVVLPGVGHDARLHKGMDRAVGWFDKYLAAPETTAPGGKDEYFDSDGVKIHYVVEGKGEPVILVHGFTGSIQRDWQGFGILAKLSQSYQVIALDNRGHGKSEKLYDRAKYGVEMASDVVHLMDHLEIKKAHVVGYSLGGVMIEYLLVHHPDRLITATIGGMGWMKAGNGLAGLGLELIAISLESGKGIGPLTEQLQPAGKAVTDKDIAGIRQSMLSNDQKALAACIRAVSALAVTEEQLKFNKVPTLAIVGETDPLKVGVDDLKKVIPNLKVEVIKGADHGGALASPKFVDGINAFLKAHSTVPAARAK